MSENIYEYLELDSDYWIDGEFNFDICPDCLFKFSCRYIKDDCKFFHGIQSNKINPTRIEGGVADGV